MSNLETEEQSQTKALGISEKDRPIFEIGGENPDEDDNILDENSDNSTPITGTIPASLGGDDVERSSAENNNLENSPALVPESDSISLQQDKGESANIPSKIKVKTPSRSILAPDVTHIPIQSVDIVEYEWPHKSGDRFFVQEQISELLGIISFKRKYPDMIRRTIQPKERDYLLKELKIRIVPPSHHLTALQSVDVHELMGSEYPEIYASYQRACNERIKMEMIEKQKELEAIRLDAKKLAELRQKAIKSAHGFNSDLQTVRKTERTQYWDLNTNIIHSQLNKWRRLPKEYTKTSKYPVFLIPGQYTDYYKKYDAAELRSFPLNTVLADKEGLFPPKRESSPQPIIVTAEEIAAAEEEEKEEDSPNDNLDEHSEVVGVSSSNDIKRAAIKQESIAISRSPQKEKHNSANGSPPLKMRKMSFTSLKKNSSFSARIPPSLSNSISSPSIQTLPESSSSACSVCQLSDMDASNAQNSNSKALLIRCSACKQQMHSSCIDMPLSMVKVIRQYDWLCIDCKRCCVCEQPDQEAAMMCCDQCDRGYHTFCIGLDQPPNGTWHCPECIRNDTSISIIGKSTKSRVMQAQRNKKYLEISDECMFGKKRYLEININEGMH